MDDDCFSRAHDNNNTLYQRWRFSVIWNRIRSIYLTVGGHLSYRIRRWARAHGFRTPVTKIILKTIVGSREDDGKRKYGRESLGKTRDLVYSSHVFFSYRTRVLSLIKYKPTRARGYSSWRCTLGCWEDNGNYTTLFRGWTLSIGCVEYKVYNIAMYNYYYRCNLVRYIYRTVVTGSRYSVIYIFLIKCEVHENRMTFIPYTHCYIIESFLCVGTYYCSY